MNKTIEHLAEVCKKHRFEEKLLFVPSYSIGHQIGECLAKTGSSWINLRWTTVAGYAEELAALDLAKQGLRLIGGQERLLVIENIIRNDESLNGPSAYFAGAAAIPGIINSLSNAIHELRMAGLKPRDLKPGDFIVHEKGAEIKRLLSAYEGFLTAKKLIDQAGLIEAAVKKIGDETSPARARVTMVLSDFPLARLEKELVTLAGKKGLAIIKHNRPQGAEIPKRFFEPTDREDGKGSKVETDVDLLPWLFSPKTAPSAVSDGSVKLFRAVGESNEVREMLRRVISAGVPLDEVSVMVSKTDPYLPLLYEITKSLEIPATFAGGIPIGYTRPGRSLLFYLKWQAEDFTAGYVRRLFSGGYLDLETSEPEEAKPSSGKAAVLFREAGIGWGRERYSDRLKALKENYLSKARERSEDGDEEGSARLERTANEVGGIDRFIAEVMATVPSEDSQQKVNLVDLCTGAANFVRRFCRVASEQDGAAKSRLVDTLESLSESPSVSEPRKDLAERLIELIEGIMIGQSGSKPGYIHVSTFRSGGYVSRSHNFVLGLDQGKFPGPLLQDPVVLDRERLALGGDMTLSQDLLEENLYVLAKVLGSLHGQVTLSYSCRDLREDRELFPSSVLLMVCRLITGKREADYSELKKYLGEAAGFYPATGAVPLNDWEWWLAQKKARYGSDSVFVGYPQLKAGEEAENEREKDELSQYDGWVPSVGKSLDPLTQDYGLSCSRLEALAKCPFAFFIKHVLRVEPLEEIEKDVSRWLDPLQRGSLLHQVFCRFVQELIQKGERAKFEKHMARLQAIAMEEVERWKQEVPPASDLAFTREMEEIKQTLEIFLRGEVDRSKIAEPMYLELSFGIVSESSCGAAEEEPVEIPIKGKGSFKLRGRIDRVDRSGEHEYEVWDYKTGSAYGYKEHGYLNKGRQLQHALYALAAEKILRSKHDKKARVVRSGYFFPGPKGEGQRIEPVKQNREEVYDVLSDLFELLRNGVFPTSADSDQCGFCDYSDICGGKDVAPLRSGEKLKISSKMESLKRLMEHE